MKRLRWTVLAAVTGSMLLMGTAYADPPVAQPPTQLGHISGRFYNPNNATQYVNWAVAIDQGNVDADEATEFFSPVGRVSQGNGMLREQIVNIRSGIGARVINDYYPSKDPFDNITIPEPPASGPDDGRNNTICRQGPTPPSPGGNVVTLNLGDDAVPATVGCQTFRKNPLHNTADYDPDTTLVRGFSDWLPTDQNNCPTERARVFFEVRFEGDPNVYAFNKVTPDVNSNGPACP